jgi:hypothetical protein
MVSKRAKLDAAKLDGSAIVLQGHGKRRVVVYNAALVAPTRPGGLRDVG